MPLFSYAYVSVMQAPDGETIETRVSVNTEEPRLGDSLILLDQQVRAGVVYGAVARNMRLLSLQRHEESGVDITVCPIKEWHTEASAA